MACFYFQRMRIALSTQHQTHLRPFIEAMNLGTSTQDRSHGTLAETKQGPGKGVPSLSLALLQSLCAVAVCVADRHLCPVQSWVRPSSPSSGVHGCAYLRQMKEGKEPLCVPTPPSQMAFCYENPGSRCDYSYARRYYPKLKFLCYPQLFLSSP